MKFVINQGFQNGVLGGPKNIFFEATIRDNTYEITVHQEKLRTITVDSASSSYQDMLHIIYSLQTFLMLFDGRFYPTISAYDGTDITSSWIKRELACYHSADFMTYSSNKLLEFDKILDAQCYKKWLDLEQQLDIIHKMVLYSLSDVKMPIDMKCAFMIEAYEGLSLLVSHERKTEYQLPKVTKYESKLQKYLNKIIDEYGSPIFNEEMRVGLNKFTHILVTSRNRIAHIQEKEINTYLNGNESLVYLLKLFLLYRVVLFGLLRIPGDMYDGRLQSFVGQINSWSITTQFLEKLGGNKI